MPLRKRAGVPEEMLAEFRVATTFFTTPRCLVRYDQNLDLFKLYNGGPWLIAGSPGSGTNKSIL